MTVTGASVILTAVLCAGCGGSAPEEQITTSAPVPVVVQTVERGTVESAVSATGVVTPGPDGDLVVTAPQPGRIALLPRAQGDVVKRGDLLVAFDIPTLAADVAAREAEIAQARARVENARAARARTEGLLERGIAARKELEDADRDLAESLAALRQAQAQRAAAAELASRARVIAPFAGQVIRRWHNPGDLVEASSTDPILRVVDLRHLELQVAVPASAAHMVAANQVIRLLAPEGDDAAAACEGRQARAIRCPAPCRSGPRPGARLRPSVHRFGSRSSPPCIGT
jgi:membrane fusion protein (multidrug efflux system)